MIYWTEAPENGQFEPLGRYSGLANTLKNDVELHRLIGRFPITLEAHSRAVKMFLQASESPSLVVVLRRSL